MTNYDFFEESCAQQRVYRVTTGWHCDQISTAVAAEYKHRPGQVPRVEITDFIEDFDEEREECTVRGSHLMHPGSPTGVAAINEAFGVSLPCEFDDFYRRWNGGLLLFQEFYELLGVEDIISLSDCLDRKNHRLHKPLNFFRFCNVRGDCYLALRKNDMNLWEVVFYEGGEAPAEYYFDSDNTPPRFESFDSWLLFVCENDGWPITNGIMGKPPAERML